MNELGPVIVGLATVAAVARHIDRVVPVVVAALTEDGRCERCGYRRDHPFVKHGEPCQGTGIRQIACS